MNFWEKLRKPFFVLAPMADVTDWAFRQIIIKCSRPDVFFTEFVSSDGLCSAGRDRLIQHLYFTKNERPIVAQFFGAKPENFYKCAQLAKELGFDGIDINMGCPDRKVIKQGAGAALIQNPALAKDIIAVTKEGAGELPVSVKTRLGFNKIEIESWLPHLIESKPAAITIHGRTKKEMSLVPAHWDAIGKASEIARNSGTLVIGNGDVEDLEDAKEKARIYRLNGIMAGRGIFKNPWFFNPEINPDSVSAEERIKLLIEHTKNFVELWGPNKNFAQLKRFYKVYIQDWDGAKELRQKFMEAKNVDEVFSLTETVV